MTKELRGVKPRTFKQKYFSDPTSAFIVFFFLLIFKILPIDVSSFLGEKLGILMGVLFKSKNKTALHNLTKVFPNKTIEEKNQIIRDMWKNLGRLCGEIPHLDAIARTRVDIEGKEHLQTAVGQAHTQTGGFFFSAHIGNWELCIRIAQYFNLPIHGVYRMANNPWIEKFLFEKRQSDKSELLPKGTVGARKMIAALKKKEWIALLTDQKANEGISVPFLGFDAMTTPSLAKIALKMKLPTYPAHVVRLHGAHFKIIIQDNILPDLPDTDENVFFMTKKINDIISEWIYDNPAQWLWIHHRWDKQEYKTDKKKQIQERNDS